MLPACSLPIKVKRIDSVNEPANGIRYILKRPVYKVGLKFKNSAFSILKTPTEIDNHIATCFEGLQANEIINIDVLIEQSLSDANPLTYEVTTPSGFFAIPHILSDTELTITTEADATLKSISAGEEDKSLEFIQAVAGIALKAAGPGFLASETTYCEVFKRPEFIKYAKNHLSIRLHLKNIKSKVDSMLASITIDNGKKVSDAIALLREEQSSLNESLKNIKFNLKKNTDYNLTVDGAVLSAAKTPWLDIKLNKKNETKENP